MILLIFTVLLSLKTYAWVDVGNGGDSVKCRKNFLFYTDVTYIMLDEYEAQSLRKVKLNLGSKDESFEDKINRTINRLARLDPQRAKKYNTWWKSFFDESLMNKGERLPNLADSGAVLIPRGCTINQVAAQQDPELPGDKRYTITEHIWKAFSNNSKAMLVMHELILRDFRSRQNAPILSTKFVRYFNIMINSEKFESMTESEYKDLVKMTFGH